METSTIWILGTAVFLSNEMFFNVIICFCIYFRSPSKPVRVINGHNKPITKMVMGHDESNPILITGGSDGRLVEWTVADGCTKLIQGKTRNMLT